MGLKDVHRFCWTQLSLNQGFKLKNVYKKLLHVMILCSFSCMFVDHSFCLVLSVLISLPPFISLLSSLPSSVQVPDGLPGIWEYSSASAVQESTGTWVCTSPGSSLSTWTSGPTSRSRSEFNLHECTVLRSLRVSTNRIAIPCYLTNREEPMQYPANAMEKTMTWFNQYLLLTSANTEIHKKKTQPLHLLFISI